MVGEESTTTRSEIQKSWWGLQELIVMGLANSQKSLRKWTKEKWRTKSGKPSTQGPEATGERYLPEKAIKSLSAEEYARTSKAKREGTKKGKQFVPQPKSVAKKVRKFRPPVSRGAKSRKRKIAQARK